VYFFVLYYFKYCNANAFDIWALNDYLLIYFLDYTCLGRLFALRPEESGAGFLEGGSEPLSTY